MGYRVVENRHLTGRDYLLTVRAPDIAPKVRAGWPVCNGSGSLPPPV